MDPLLLVLDLDETLIHATEEPLAARPPDFTTSRYAVYKRPHLSEFLSHVLGRYRVAIWTSAGRDYAEEVVGQLLDPTRLEFLWCAERTTWRFDHETRCRHSTKKLRKLRKRYDLNRTLVVDDSPEKHVLNYGNLIRIRPFEGDERDAELVLLKRYIEEVEQSPNFRAVEKRWWRETLD